MKRTLRISQLIGLLSAAQNDYGDSEVWLDDSDGKVYGINGLHFASVNQHKNSTDGILLCGEASAQFTPDELDYTADTLDDLN